MLTAIGLGALSAGSLVIGVLVAFVRRWSPRQIGIVLGFGAGALVSAVSFELAEEGLRLGGLGYTALGLAAGALTYYVLDGVIERRFPDGAGTSLALGAIFISNLPEATGSASQMLEHGTRHRRILALWVAVAVLCTAATGAGWGMASVAPDELRAAIDGFAAGALLVMLSDSMIPDARRGAGPVAGLATTLGFAVAIALSSLS